MRFRPLWSEWWMHRFFQKSTPCFENWTFINVHFWKMASESWNFHTSSLFGISPPKITRLPLCFIYLLALGSRDDHNAAKNKIWYFLYILRLIFPTCPFLWKVVFHKKLLSFFNIETIYENLSSIFLNNSLPYTKLPVGL